MADDGNPETESAVEQTWAGEAGWVRFAQLKYLESDVCDGFSDQSEGGSDPS
jgi:hypothetical protein